MFFEISTTGTLNIFTPELSQKFESFRVCEMKLRERLTIHRELLCLKSSTIYAIHSQRSVDSNPSAYLHRISISAMHKDVKGRNDEIPEGEESRTGRNLSSLLPRKRTRKTSTEGGERRKKFHHEGKPTEPSQATVSKGPTSESLGTTGKDLEQQSTEAPYVILDTSAISFFAKPSGSVLLDFIRRLVLDQDFELVNSVPDLAALEAASLHFMQVYTSSSSYLLIPMSMLIIVSVQALVWSGEVVNRLTQARDEVFMTRSSMDGVLDRHNELMKQLEEIRV
ncbi:galactose oxidase-like [Dorcoceras hygrometricum]|uniref:Galactose oxidase-like n=1 Tax=Dorcoceras hygrometricum TaxID=472368 RepID=A0A2Z7D074_9LAMI|nr:galactose oxidase-like [Dorcoceras hygrometricum]